MRLKMRKVKPVLRATKKKLSKKYETSITEVHFSKAQLKLLQDFITSEQKRERIKSDYNCNVVKIGHIGVGEFKKYQDIRRL